jgi:hypothetical protein
MILGLRWSRNRLIPSTESRVSLPTFKISAENPCFFRQAAKYPSEMGVWAG